MKPFLLPAVALSALSFAACGKNESKIAHDTSSSAGISRLIEQSTEDIRVQNVTVSSYSLSNVKVSSCPNDRSGNPHQPFVNFDCTKPVAEEIARQEGGRAAILLDTVRYSSSMAQLPESVECKVTTIETAILASALPGASQVGFFLGNRGTRTVPAHTLRGNGISMKDAQGRDVLVHRFAVVGPCRQGASSLEFKPFIDFLSGRDTYRNWDARPSNYVVSESY